MIFTTREPFFTYRSWRMSWWQNSSYPYPCWLTGVGGRSKAGVLGWVTKVLLMWRLSSPSSLWSSMDKVILRPVKGHCRTSSLSDCIKCTNREICEPQPVPTPFGFTLEKQNEQTETAKIIAKNICTVFAWSFQQQNGIYLFVLYNKNYTGFARYNLAQGLFVYLVVYFYIDSIYECLWTMRYRHSRNCACFVCMNGSKIQYAGPHKRFVRLYVFKWKFEKTVSTAMSCFPKLSTVFLLMFFTQCETFKRRQRTYLI